MKLLRHMRRPVMQDEIFARIDWDKSFRPKKNPALKNLIDELDKQNGSRQYSIVNQLPYITIRNLENLFSLIRDEIVKPTGNAVIISKVQIVNQLDGNWDETQQAFVENLRIDADYQNLLIPLVQTVFTDERFDRAPFQGGYVSKVAYFQQGLFPTYEELNFNQNKLPLIPTEEEIQAAKETNSELTIQTPEQRDQVRQKELAEKKDNSLPEKTLRSELAESEERPVVAPQVDNSEEASMPPTHPNFTMQSSTDMPDITEKTMHAEASKDEYGKELDDWDSLGLEEKTDLVSTPQVKVVTDPLRNLKVNITFPRFEIITFPKVSYAPYEEEYPAWKLNEQKKAWNDLLKQQEDKNQWYANQAVLQQLTLLERTEQEALNHKLIHADHRNELKGEVLAEVKTRQMKDLASQQDSLKEQHTANLIRLKQEYDQNVRNAESDYAEAQKQIKIENEKAFFKQFQDEYQERYFAASRKLENMKEEGLSDISKLLIDRQESLSAEKTMVAEKVGQQLFAMYESRLKNLNYNLKVEHTNARQEYNLQRQETLNTNLVQDTQQQVRQLKSELSKREADQQRLEAKLKQADQELILQKEKSLDEKTALTKDLINQSKINQSEKKQSSTVVKSKRFGLKIMVAMVLGIVLGSGIAGGVAYYQHQEAQHNAQIAKINQKIDSQRNQNIRLKEQRDQAVAENTEITKTVNKLKNQLNDSDHSKSSDSKTNNTDSHN